MKQIKLSYIKKINSLQMDIFCIEDDNQPSKVAISNKNRGIKNTLNKITNDLEEQILIESTISKHLFNTEDYSYKPICNDLRALGYEIVYE